MTRLRCLTLIAFSIFVSNAHAQSLVVFPKAVALEIVPLDFEAVTSTEGLLQVTVDTRALRGSRWRLWLETLIPPEYSGMRFRPEAISWTAQPPFLNGRLLSSQRVLVGEGPTNGDRFNGRLVLRADEDAPTSGEYRGSFILTLEEIP